MAQELISHKVLSLDFWQDTVTYAGRRHADRHDWLRGI